MKRYELEIVDTGIGTYLEHVEKKDGMWVKYEDAKALHEALKRMVGVCSGYLENQLPSDADLYNPNYVSPLSQARDAIKKAKGRPE